MFDQNDPARSFLRGCPFAVPAHLVRPKLDQMTKRRPRPRKTAVKVGDYAIDAYVFQPKLDTRNDATLEFCLDTIMIGVTLGFKFTDDYAIQTCVAGDRLMPLITKPGQVAIHREKEPAEAIKRALAVYEPLLCRFSRLTGLDPHFYCDGEDVRAPLPYVLGEAHIFTCAHPPGESRTRYFHSAGGLPLTSDGREVVGYEPTAGRGMTLGDESGSLVQVIGSNIYFLLPTMSDFDPQISPHLFEYLLVLGWEGYQRHQFRPPAANRPARRKDFVASTKQWVESGRAELTKSLAVTDNDIEQTQRHLAELFRCKRELEDYIRSFERMPFIQGALARLPGDYRRIKAEPDVAMIAIVSDGIHVDTKPLHIEYEGRRYAVGSFTIRIGRRGAVTVWCETPLHPKGVPHPHIAKDGGPCFGNASHAIIKAGAEHRYHDVVTMVLRWLRDGYSPQLAAVKIEEWPVAQVLNDAATPAVDAVKGGGQ